MTAGCLRIDATSTASYLHRSWEATYARSPPPRARVEQMAIVQRIRTLRPPPERVAEIQCPPYDVISTNEARALAVGRDASFLRVIRPEIQFAPDVDEHSDEVYAAGRDALLQMIRDGGLQHAPDALYVYTAHFRGRTQTGVFGGVSVDAYDAEEIVRHENTRVDKEDDRTRHILTQGAHAEPVMLAYRDVAAIDALVADATRLPPIFDFRDDADVRHQLWVAPDPDALERAFEAVPKLYVADGHHRCKAASRAAAALHGADANTAARARRFPAVVIPIGQMQIMPYHRLVADAPANIIERLRASMHIAPGAPTPPGAGHVSMFHDGAWYDVALPPSDRQGRAAQLDVARLSEHILEPMLGINDPRTDPRISFVGGIRGTEPLVQAVESGDARLAFSMWPTSMHELLEVSDAGELMPPKSTWFEPKLASGMLVHPFDPALG